MFEDVLGSWFLRLGNVKMAQAILDLCGVPLDARSTVSQCVLCHTFMSLLISW